MKTTNTKKVKNNLIDVVFSIAPAVLIVIILTVLVLM